MTDHDPIATAWSIHAALADWTGKVDAKASFALTIETALLAGVVSVSGTGHRLGQRHGAVGVLYWAGVAGLLAGLILAAVVVTPRLRSHAVQREAPANFVYFGHLRSWAPVDLEEALRQRPLLPVLSRQLVRMSQIAWRKHRQVQLSIASAGAGSSLLAIAAIAS